MLESVIQAKFIKQVKHKGLGLAVKVDSPSRRGFPDVVFIDRDGHTLYIEFKTDRGRLSPHQHAIHDEMIALGADVMVLYGERGLNKLMAMLEAES